MLAAHCICERLVTSQLPTPDCQDIRSFGRLGGWELGAASFERLLDILLVSDLQTTHVSPKRREISVAANVRLGPTEREQR